MSIDRRNFIKKTTLASAAITVGSSAMAMSAKSYNNIIGANERLNVAIAGLDRRLGAFKSPIALKESNAKLLYLCDVMESQRLKALKAFRDYEKRRKSDEPMSFNPKELNIKNATFWEDRIENEK